MCLDASSICQISRPKKPGPQPTPNSKYALVTKDAWMGGLKAGIHEILMHGPMLVAQLVSLYLEKEAHNGLSPLSLPCRLEAPCCVKALKL